MIKEFFNESMEKWNQGDETAFKWYPLEVAQEFGYKPKFKGRSPDFENLSKTIGEWITNKIHTPEEILNGAVLFMADRYMKRLSSITYIRRNINFQNLCSPYNPREMQDNLNRIREDPSYLTRFVDGLTSMEVGFMKGMFSDRKKVKPLLDYLDINYGRIAQKNSDYDSAFKLLLRELFDSGKPFKVRNGAFNGKDIWSITDEEREICGSVCKSVFTDLWYNSEPEHAWKTLYDAVDKRKFFEITFSNGSYSLKIDGEPC